MFDIESCASVCHEAIRAIKIANGEDELPHWENASKVDKKSTMDSIQTILSGATLREVHERWSAAKIAAGWVYGPVKNSRKKTHPCLVDYSDLPPVQLMKDEIFASIVNTMRRY